MPTNKFTFIVYSLNIFINNLVDESPTEIISILFIEWQSWFKYKTQKMKNH